MIIPHLSSLFQRDLVKLKAELEQYQSEDLLWKTAGTISNTAGNLALHLAGNLSHFIGAVLGNTGYVRNREAEFSLKHVPREELHRQIDQAMQAVNSTLSSLSESALDKEYPIQVFGQPMTTGYFLVHLAAHLNYHLGQINYHRRLIA